MANIKSQIKRNKTNASRHDRNVVVKSALKTEIRRVGEAIAAGDGELARAAARKAARSLDKAASKGILHPNQAANRKSAVMSKAGQA